MQLVLIRGLPGSGKTTYANKHFPWHCHFEADMYFARTGEYKFDWRKLNEAHAWCQASVLSELLNGNDVVVTNTFTQDWEFDKYIEMAFELGAHVTVIELKTQFQNIHGVPEEKMEVMRGRWHDWDTVAPQFKNVNVTYEVVS